VRIDCCRKRCALESANRFEPLVSSQAASDDDKAQGFGRVVHVGRRSLAGNSVDVKDAGTKKEKVEHRNGNSYSNEDDQDGQAEPTRQCGRRCNGQ